MEEIEIGVISQRTRSASITVQGAYKRYGRSNVILKGLNMTVEEGTIYGFLGPSGCGKTSLLNCIVGRSNLDSGVIKISAKRRSEIGFMPQEISLYADLTVFENLFIFGYLAGMTTNEILARTQDLISFLELPDQDRFVKNMSGGQQRRLSIAVTLLHDPTIIILDEPTVGIDPILCHQIWQKLLELSRKGKSIIITTHYIQEAQQAHTIGLMRNGKLLAEENPTVLMNQYECEDLENVFVKLIQEGRAKSGNQGVESSPSTDDSSYPKSTAEFTKVHYEGDDRILSKRIIRTLIFKNYLVMRRGYLNLLFILTVPVLQCYIFNYTVGNKPEDLRIAILNEEISIRHCYPAVYSGCIFDDDTIPSSCLFLKYLKAEKYKIVEYHNEIKALDDLRKRKVYCILRIPKDYTKKISQKISKGPFNISKEGYDENFSDGFIDVWLETSNRVNKDFIKYDISYTSTLFVRKVMTQCGKNPDIADLPLKFEEPIRGKAVVAESGNMAVGILILGGFYFSAYSTNLFFISEKVGGQVERSFIYGVTMFEMIVALCVIQFTIGIYQAIATYAITFFPFDNPMNGNVITFSGLLLLTTFSGVFFGIVQTLVTDNITAAAYAGVGSGFILGVTSGLFGPRESQKEALKWISGFLPVTWEVDAARKVANRGLEFGHAHVIRGYYSTVGWSTIFLIIIFYYSKYKH